MDHSSQVKVSKGSMEKTPGKSTTTSSRATPAGKSSQASHNDRGSSRGRDRQASVPDMSHVGLVPCDPSMTNQMLQSWYNYSMYNMFLNAVANQAAVADMMNRSQMQLMPDLSSPKQQQQHKKGSSSTPASTTPRPTVPHTQSSAVPKSNIATATSSQTQKPTHLKKDASSLPVAASRTVSSRSVPSLSTSRARRDVGKDGHVRQDVHHPSPRASSSSSTSTSASIPSRNIIPAHCKKDTNKLIDDLIHKAYGRSSLPSPKSVVPAHSKKEITSVPDRTRDNYQHAFRPRACTSRQMTDPTSDIPKSSHNQNDSNDSTSVLDLSKSRNVTSSSNNCQNRSEYNSLTNDKQKYSSSLFTTRRPDHKQVRGILSKRPRIMDNPYLQKVCAAGMKTAAPCTATVSSEVPNNNMLKLESTEVSSMIDRLFQSVGESSGGPEIKTKMDADAQQLPTPMDTGNPCNEVSSSEPLMKSYKSDSNRADFADGRPVQTSPTGDNLVTSCDIPMETSPPLSQSESRQTSEENKISFEDSETEQGVRATGTNFESVPDDLELNTCRPNSDSEALKAKRPPDGPTLAEKVQGSIEAAFGVPDEAPLCFSDGGNSEKAESVIRKEGETKQTENDFEIPEIRSDISKAQILESKEDDLQVPEELELNESNNVLKSTEDNDISEFDPSQFETGEHVKTKIILSETEGTFSVSKDESSESENDFPLNMMNVLSDNDNNVEKDDLFYSDLKSELVDSMCGSESSTNSEVAKRGNKRRASDLLESDASVKLEHNSEQTESECSRGENIYEFSHRRDNFTPPLVCKTWNFRESVRRLDSDKNKMLSDSDSDFADANSKFPRRRANSLDKNEIDNKNITDALISEHAVPSYSSVSVFPEFKQEPEESNQNQFEETGVKSIQSDISVSSSFGSEQVLSDSKDMKDEFYAFPSTSFTPPPTISKRGRGHRGKRGRKRQDDGLRKPHMCKKCGLGFTREGDLERHKRSHLGQKLYVCEYCQKSFVRGYYYKLHVSLHEVNDAPSESPSADMLSEKLEDVPAKHDETQSSSGESSDSEEEQVDGSALSVDEPDSESDEKPLKNLVSDSEVADATVPVEEEEVQDNETPLESEVKSEPIQPKSPLPSPSAIVSAPAENGELEEKCEKDEAKVEDKESPLKIASVVSLAEPVADRKENSPAPSPVPGPSSAPGIVALDSKSKDGHEITCSSTSKISNGVCNAFLDAPIKSESPGLKIASVTSLPPEMAETKFGIKMLEPEPPKPAVPGSSSYSSFVTDTKTFSKPAQQDCPKPSSSYASFSMDSKDLPKPTTFKKEFFEDLSTADSISKANFLASAGLTVDTNITANYANSTMVTATPETDFSLILNTDPIPCTPSDFIFPDDEMFSNSPKEYLDLDTTTRPKASDCDPMKLLHVDSMIKLEPNNDQIVLNVKVETEMQFGVLNKPIDESLGFIKKEVVDIKTDITNPCSPLSGLDLNGLGAWDDSENSDTISMTEDLTYRPAGSDLGLKPKKRGSKKGVKKPRKAKFLHRFKCKQCPKDFARYGDLKKHESQHTGDNLSICEFCGKVFLRRCFYLIHLQRHKGGKYIHHQCGLRFPSKTALKTHMRFCKKLTNDEKKEDIFSPPTKNKKSDVENTNLIDEFLPNGLKCEAGEMRNCNNNIYPKTKFNDLDIKGEEKVTSECEDNGEYTCDICGKKYIWLSALVYHKRCHTGEKPYRCPQCGKTFRAAGTLRIHIRYHNNERPFICEKCGKSYTEKGTLKCHLRTHSGERKFKCPYCAKMFAWREHMRYHIKIHTGERPHKCEECGKRFPDRGSLKVHWRSHSNERPYACGMCDMRYKSSKQLLIHRRTHTGEKPFSCSDCKMRFRALGNLKRHSLTHTREKPFKCKFCPKGFRSHSNLNEHMNIHTGNKPHRCKLCDKKFANSGSLAKHIATHSDEKPFCCNICQKCFRDKGDLKSHMRCHTDERPFACPVCGQGFKHKCHIKKHMRTHTRNK